MNMAEIHERIWREVEPKVYVSRSEFLDDLRAWQITPKEIDGDIVGATLVRGAEFHFVSFGLQKVFPPMLIRDCLQPIIDQHGFVLTRTPKEDEGQRRFNVRIGFRIESEDEFYIYFRMNQLNLHGARKCLS